MLSLILSMYESICRNDLHGFKWFTRVLKTPRWMKSVLASKSIEKTYKQTTSSAKLYWQDHLGERMRLSGHCTACAAHFHLIFSMQLKKWQASIRLGNLPYFKWCRFTFILQRLHQKKKLEGHWPQLHGLKKKEKRNQTAKRCVLHAKMFLKLAEHLHFWLDRNYACSICIFTTTLWLSIKHAVWRVLLRVKATPWLCTCCPPNCTSRWEILKWTQPTAFL